MQQDFERKLNLYCVTFSKYVNGYNPICYSSGLTLNIYLAVT
jgi:hypothetical protein